MIHLNQMLSFGMDQSDDRTAVFWSVVLLLDVRPMDIDLSALYLHVQDLLVHYMVANGKKTMD